MSIKETLEKAEVQIDLAKMELKDKVDEFKDRQKSEQGLREEAAAIALAKLDAEADLDNQE